MSISLEAQTRYYVAPTATGANSGLSWTDAFTGLQPALAAAQAGDTVWVAQGFYVPDSGTDRSISFEPRSGVRLYGGFTGMETTLEARNSSTNPTILSGNIGNPSDSSDNSYNVVYLHLPDSLTVLDGFIIEDGRADYNGATTIRDRKKCGGGLYINGQDWEAYPLITNCQFRRNMAVNYGGGVFINGGGLGSVAPQILNCQFVRNRTQGSGGGLCRFGGSWIERGVDLEGCRFEENYAFNYGGGYYYDDNERSDDMDFIRDTFFNNEAILIGGGMRMDVGRIASNAISFSNCLFKNNHSDVNFELEITSIDYKWVDMLVFTRCSFLNTENIVKNTSGLQISPFGESQSILGFDSCEFRNYLTNLRALQIIFEGSRRISISSSIFLNNKCSNLVSCSYGLEFIISNSIFERNTLYGSLVLLNLNYNYSCVKNSIIFKNIYNSPPFFASVTTKTLHWLNNLSDSWLFPSGLSGRPDTLIFSNNIYLHTNAYSNIGKKFTAIDKSLFRNFDCNLLTQTGNVNCGPGILVGADPLFRDTAAGDYHLLPCSPLLNAGNNAVIAASDTDLDGQPRIQGSAVDIGPYESSPLTIGGEPETLAACIGINNGSIIIQPENACFPVSYSWISPTGQGSGLDSLYSGIYTVTITDSKNETVVLSVNLPDSPSPQATAQTSPVVCGTGTGGTAMLNITGLQPPFTVAWNNGSTENPLLNLGYGTYAATLTDARGCTGVTTAQVGRMGNLQVDIQPTPPLCHGSSDGSILVQALTGLAPFEWLWSDGASTPDLNNLPSGTYNGSVSDALGCGISWSFLLDAPDSIVLSATVVAASGPFNADGSISISPSGGSGIFTALWSTGNTGLSLGQLVPGTYSVTLTDDHGCSALASIVVNWTIATQEPHPTVAVALWPNPAVEYVELVSSEPFNAAGFRLYDTEGRIVRDMQFSGSRMLVEVDELPPGIYYWTLNQRFSGYLVVAQ